MFEGWEDIVRKFCFDFKITFEESLEELKELLFEGWIVFKIFFC